MSIQGWYYQHHNGDLIYRRELGGTAADIRESDFAVGLWPFDSDDRAMAWDMLIEALAGGARADRVMQLAEKWGCDDNDAQIYAELRGVKLYPDGNKQCATRTDFINPMESACGFGDTNLEAMADLCKALGYKPSTMWGTSFKQLVRPLPDAKEADHEG
jgi:hypothetical protein